MTNELKKCPFCGGDAIVDVLKEHERYYAFVKCISCLVETNGYMIDFEKAIERWNVRK